MAESKQSSASAKTRKDTKRDYIYAVGRRREAVARVRLHAVIKDGASWGEYPVSRDQMLVNGMPIDKYFSGPIAKAKYLHPLDVTDTHGMYAFTVKVEGGGKAAQLEAMIQGMARALATHSTELYRPVLKAKGLLTRDARVRERRKVGTGGKARRKKQSPKR